MDNFIGDNINAIRIDRGLSQAQLADIAGVKQQTISSWESGSSTPRRNAVMKIINRYPDLTFDSVMSKENGYASKVFNSDKRNDEWIDVPLYGSIAAGTPIEMENVESTFVIPSAMKRRYPNAFLLKVCGESMNRKLPNGSYALIDPTDDVIDGNAYAICVNGYDATIKRVRRLANGFELIPDSTDPTIRGKVYDYGIEGTETITVIGEVVWCVYPFDYDF